MRKIFVIFVSLFVLFACSKGIQDPDVKDEAPEKQKSVVAPVGLWVFTFSENNKQNSGPLYLYFTANGKVYTASTDVESSLFVGTYMIVDIPGGLLDSLIIDFDLYPKISQARCRFWVEQGAIGKLIPKPGEILRWGPDVSMMWAPSRFKEE
ncbi:MAG: hypothetical protein V1707_02145 [bacterium]